jgi:hypothetical protein
VIALGVEREVDHHDGVLLHDLIGRMMPIIATCQFSDRRSGARESSHLAVEIAQKSPEIMSG